MADPVREEDKFPLVLAYLHVLALVPLLTGKSSAFVRWHARQGLALAAVWTAWAVAVSLLGLVPALGYLAAFTGCLGHLAALGVICVAVVRALGGERWAIPLVARLAERLPCRG